MRNGCNEYTMDEILQWVRCIKGKCEITIHDCQLYDFKRLAEAVMQQNVVKYS